MVATGPIVEAQPLEVWAEHWSALEVAIAMQSQMSVTGMGAVLGYRYEALPAVMDLIDVPLDVRREMFANLRVIEAEVVRLIGQRRNG